MWTTSEKVLAVTAVGSTSVGLTVGYLIAKRNLKTKYEEIAEREIREAKVYYSGLQKPASPFEMVAVQNEVPVDVKTELEDEGQEEALVRKAVESLQYGQVESSDTDKLQAVQSIHDNADEEDSSSMNVFTESAAYTDSVTEEDRAERANREANELPYIISMEEFMQGEREYEQVTLTYYEADDVLSDDKDVPVPDSDAAVGDDNLTRFGFLSKDRNIVYVRNDRLNMDIEVIRSHGSFAEEVHGILKHEDRPGRGKIRKFRGFDD